MGGTSAERDISIKTGDSVFHTLSKAGYKVVKIDPKNNMTEELEKHKIDVAFIALHGPLGEDGSMQGFLEVMDIPYTGSKVLASALSMDKLMAKKIFLEEKIATPKFEVVHMENQNKKIELDFPVMIKPLNEGSAIDIYLVRRKEDMHSQLIRFFEHQRIALIEEYVEGREFTVALLNGEALPVIEIEPKNEFYDFEAKYTEGGAKFTVPANITKEEEKEMKEISHTAFNALGCTTYGRVDVMMDEDSNIFVLEVNTVPGLTSLSLFPKACAAHGIGYVSVLEKILCDAIKERY